MKIYLVSGKARHGKDTISGFLKEELEKLGANIKIYDIKHKNKYNRVRTDNGKESIYIWYKFHN